MWQHESGLRERQFSVIAGVDEAGRGPLAGPVVAAAVILPHECCLNGINDSKKLTEKKRESLFDYIQDAASAFGVGLATVEEIDRINILQASFLAMCRALEQMGCEYDAVLVDGHLKIPQLNNPQKCVIGGDAQSASIAAASILAKVTRDRLMRALHAQYPQYAFNEHKGYNTPLHRARLTEYGVSPVHRRSYAPVAALLDQGESPQCLLPIL